MNSDYPRANSPTGASASVLANRRPPRRVSYPDLAPKVNSQTTQNPHNWPDWTDAERWTIAPEMMTGGDH